MVKLLVMCGTGIATSTIVTGKIKAWLEENNYSSKVKVIQGKIGEELNRIDDYDVIISTTLVPDNIKDKVIMGVPLITGMNTGPIYEQIKGEIDKNLNK